MARCAIPPGRRGRGLGTGLVATGLAATGLLLLPSCTTAPRLQGSGSDPHATLARLSLLELPDTQRLYRAQIEGESGEGGLRLTLRVVAGGDFQIEASDNFGRKLWSLRLESGVGLVVDHRRRVVCRRGSRVPVPEISLADLPLATIPRVLLGWVPVPPSRPVDWVRSGTAEYFDGDGGRWRLGLMDGSLTAWTYFGAGERPLLWWSRDGRGASVLSHRDGTQLRWSESVAEDLTGGLPPPVVDETYEECAP